MDLKEAAAAEARENMAKAWAAVEGACIRSAAEYLSDFDLRSPEEPDKTVFDAAYDMEVRYWGRSYQDLPRNMWETSTGEDMEDALKESWTLALAKQLLAMPGADSLRAWAEQEAGDPADAVARNLLETDLDLDERIAEEFVDLINKVGRMTVREVLTAGSGARRDAPRGEGQGRRDREQFQHHLRCQEFYRENKAAFLQACGLEDRRIGIDDRTTAEDGVRRLGWTLEQRVMFAEGAPRDALSGKLRALLKQKTFGVLPEAS
ncbi:hypothetical protein ACFQ36_17040 [Arthrobacter sp. GCM10027362]|uniref:hypothetical protein n=1 Tax=Arthrobacter sp. GCM10027362 TaxID=3273379 RepID=UPI00363EC4AD